MSWNYDKARKVRLLGLSNTLAAMAGGKDLTADERQDLACNLSNLMRGELGAYVQCWLPSDVKDYQPEGEPELTEDEIEDVLHRMGKYDDAAMEANANLLESLVSDVIRERKEDAR